MEAIKTSKPQEFKRKAIKCPNCKSATSIKRESCSQCNSILVVNEQITTDEAIDSVS